MSEAETGPPRLTDLPRDADLYLRWIEEFLHLELSGLQRSIGRALREHKRVVVLGANGPGKTYASVAGALAFLMCHSQSKVIATSGTYGKLRRTFCRPLSRLHREARDRYGLPGTYKQSPPRIDVAEEWFFEAARPRDAGELEGTHAPHLLAVIDEADKPNVDEAVLDSMESLLTDDNDRILAIANPPTDRANIVADLADDAAWHTIRCSSFDSRNVRIETGDAEGEPIEGLISLDEIRRNWESWNREPWPGVEEARTAHRERGDLDARWYRRRVGVIPPANAAVHRPFTIEDVEAAYDRPMPTETAPEAFGVDVARAGGDHTAVAAVHLDGALRVHGRWKGTDHNENETRIRDRLTDRPIAIDATGEGSALADRLTRAYPKAQRFNAGGKPEAEAEYYDAWSEALHLLGQYLDGGASFDDRTLREELLAAARVVEFEERHLDSRGYDGATVLKCSSKDEIKDHLGRSPDVLDAVLMACWANHNVGRAGAMIVSKDSPFDEDVRYL